MTESSHLSGLIDFADPEGSEKRLSVLLEETSEAEERLRIQTQIARCMGLRGCYSDAKQLLRELEKGLPSEPTVSRVRAHLEMGRCLNDEGDRKGAQNRFADALKLSKEIGDHFLMLDAAHMLAIAGTIDEQIRWGEEALALAEGAQEQARTSWLGPILNNLAWSYFEAKSYGRALELFEKAVDARRDGPKRPYLVAQYAVARSLRALERTEEALELLKQLRKANDEIGSPAPFVEVELGECLTLLGRSEEARSHFSTAYELLKDNSALEQPELERLRKLAQGNATTVP